VPHTVVPACIQVEELTESVLVAEEDSFDIRTITERSGVRPLNEARARRIARLAKGKEKGGGGLGVMKVRKPPARLVCRSSFCPMRLACAPKHLTLAFLVAMVQDVGSHHRRGGPLGRERDQCCPPVRWRPQARTQTRRPLFHAPPRQAIALACPVGSAQAFCQSGTSGQRFASARRRPCSWWRAGPVALRVMIGNQILDTLASLHPASVSFHSVMKVDRTS